MAIDTSLTGGSVCKEAYLQLIVTAGYDLKIIGVKLAIYETMLADEKREGTQEGCE